MDKQQNKKMMICPMNKKCDSSACGHHIQHIKVKSCDYGEYYDCPACIPFKGGG